MLSGKPIAQAINEETRQAVSKYVREGNNAPALHVLMCQDPPEDVMGYFSILERTCQKVGMGCVAHSHGSTKQHLETVASLNCARDCTGILVSLPMPEHIDTQEIIRAISIDKDVDCLHPESLGRLFIGATGHRPCTPAAALALLDAYAVPLCGSHAVVVGSSNVVGKPLAHMLLERGTTVTLCNIHTKNLSRHLRGADIIVAAAGSSHLITPDMVGEAQTLIDIGTNYKQDGTINGDIHPDCSKKASRYTPVPGGIGPITTALLVNACVPD